MYFYLPQWRMDAAKTNIITRGSQMTVQMVTFFASALSLVSSSPMDLRSGSLRVNQVMMPMMRAIVPAP